MSVRGFSTAPGTTKGSLGHPPRCQQRHVLPDTLRSHPVLSGHQQPCHWHTKQALCSPRHTGCPGTPLCCGARQPHTAARGCSGYAGALLAACALANLATTHGGRGCPRARPSPWSRAWAPWLERAECPIQRWDQGGSRSAPYTSKQLSQGGGLCGIPTREVS